MPRYVNVGAPLERDDGTIVETEQEFEPTPRELVMNAHKLHPAEEEGALFEGEGVSVRWPMAMHPELYLKIYPNGPHAKAAAQVVTIEAQRTEALKPKRAVRRLDPAVIAAATDAARIKKP